MMNLIQYLLVICLALLALYGDFVSGDDCLSVCENNYNTCYNNCRILITICQSDCRNTRRLCEAECN